MNKGPSVRDRLYSMGVRPKKEYGQNFVIRDDVIHTIIDFGRPTETEKLVEVGPGLGALTEELAEVAPLTVIEIEEDFCRDLESRIPNLTVINDDVRHVDFSEIGRDLVVFGNLPYSFSTDIIFHLIAFAPSMKRSVLLLQKEFANRIAAEPIGREYGVLSISTQLWCNVRLGPIIPGDAFYPKAKVDSRVIELTYLDEPRFPVDFLNFRTVVSSAFAKRRKKILNSMMSGHAFNDKEVLTAALEKADISPGQRAETVSIEKFAKLSEILYPA